MDLGVCVASSIDDIEYAVLAEELGYSHLWFADSQMLWSDCYATMALAATRTERIKIGTGVAVAGTRSSAVTAAAHATINRLAPGRVFCGIGTGNTANRVMGAKPMPIAEFERYIAELRLLLDGGEAEVAFRGGTRPVRHLMPDAGFVGLHAAHAAVRLRVRTAGDGARRAPRRRARHVGAAERRGAGADVGPPRRRRRRRRHPPRPRVVPHRHPDDDGRAAAGRDAGVASGSAAERRDRHRLLHYLFEQWKEAGRPERPPRFDFWDDYVAMLDATDPERLHQRIHQGHNCWVLDEEWRVRDARADRRHVHGRHRRRARRAGSRAGRGRAQPGDDPAAARRQGGRAARRRRRRSCPTSR